MALPQPTIQYEPQQFDPLASAGKIISLRNLTQAGQLQQQQLQTDQLENQQRQMALNDQKIVRDAFVKNNGDLDKTLMDAAKGGASPQTLQGLQQHALQVKSSTLDLVQKKGAIALQQADQMQGAHDTVMKAPPEQRPQVYQQQLAALSQSGVDVSQLPPQYPGDGQFKVMGAVVSSHKQQVEDAAKQAGIQKDTAQATEATAAAGKTGIETDLLKQYGGLNAAQLESKYLNVQMNKKLGRPVTPEDQAFAQAYEKNKTLGQVTTFNLQGGGSKFGPDDPSVQAVASGHMKIGDVLTPRTPYPVRQQFLAAVMQAKPDFNSADYDIEKGVMKDFTSGASAKNLNAFNTAIAHATQLQKAADALGNGDMPTLNKIGNALGYQFGSDKMTNFNVIKNALSGEVSKVFKGGQATDAEIRQVEEPFSSANSPAQLKGAIQNAIHLMNSKRDALKQQYASGTKAQPNFGDQGASTGISVKAPNGKTYTFKDQASADAFKQRAGIQ